MIYEVYEDFVTILKQINSCETMKWKWIQWYVYFWISVYLLVE